MYADRITDSMRHAIDETNRRRQIQEAYNTKNNISPVGITKAVHDITERLVSVKPEDKKAKSARELAANMQKRELERMIREMENQMRAAAKELEFERAAMLRDQVYELKAILVEDSNLPPWKKQILLAQNMDD